MDLTEKGVVTQLNNIQEQTGKNLDELRAIIHNSGLTKHSEIRSMLQQDLGLSFVHADTLILCLKQMDAEREAKEKGITTHDVVGQFYVGPKAKLRPIHDKLMEAINQFGPFEIAPKKGYVSLRRKKQFAMIGPATNTRVEVGLNMKGVEGTDRLETLPPGNLCSHKVKLTDAEQVDSDLIAWIKQAYDMAG